MFSRPLLNKGKALSLHVFIPLLSPGGVDSLCPPTTSCCISLWPDICLPSPHGSPTWFHFWASHPPTLALSSVTQPKTHADSFPSPMVTLLAARLGMGPLPHALSVHLVLPGHLPLTWGYLLKFPRHTPLACYQLALGMHP